MSITIEILDKDGAHIPTPKTFAAKPAIGDKPARAERTVFEQKAFVDLGGVFPVLMKITLDDHKDAYPVGKYQISPDSFEVNNFGQLALKRFDFKLIPLTNELKKVS